MRTLSIKLGVALAALLLTAPSALAQQSALEPLVGTWTMELTPPGEQARALPVNLAVEADTLQMVVEGGRPFRKATLEEETLSFIIPTGHGDIECALYRQDADAFSGVCVGGLGESPTTLRRKKEEEGAQDSDS